MDINTLILAVVVAVLIFTFYMGLDTFMNKQKQVKELKDRLAPDGSTMSSDGGELYSDEKEKSPLAKTLEGFLPLMGVSVESAVKKIEPRLHQAGIESPSAAIYYLFMQRAGAIFFILISLNFFLAGGTGLNKLLNFMLGGMCVIAGLFGPNLFLNNKIQKRQNTLMRSFPDALDLLLVCVESGLALDAAISRVCKELGRAHPEITKELNRTRLELALLNDRARALMNLGERTNLVPFRSLVAALIQTEKFGTSLTDTLRVLSEDYRLARLMNAENKAGRLPALMTIPLITMLIPALMIVILGPSILRVTTGGGIFGGVN